MISPRSFQFRNFEIRLYRNAINCYGSRTFLLCDEYIGKGVEDRCVGICPRFLSFAVRDGKLGETAKGLLLGGSPPTNMPGHLLYMQKNMTQVGDLFEDTFRSNVPLHAQDYNKAGMRLCKFAKFNHLFLHKYCFICHSSISNTTTDIH